MSFLGQSILQNILPTLIEPYDVSKVGSASYELSLGNEVYLTNSDSGKVETLDASNKQIEIRPGQFALLLTEEKVTIPQDKIAFISIKAGQKFKGLVNISGFHVDPGFSGKLIFSVYNAGPSSIVLEKGMPYFMIWFSELDGNGNYNGSHQGQSSIPATHVEKLKGELASPNVLLDKIKAIEKDLSRRWWLLTIILTVAITTCVRFYWQKLSYEDGFNSGYSKEKIEKEVNNKVELIINQKMDSLINSRIEDSLEGIE